MPKKKTDKRYDVHVFHEGAKEHPYLNVDDAQLKNIRKHYAMFKNVSAIQVTELTTEEFTEPKEPEE